MSSKVVRNYQWFVRYRFTAADVEAWQGRVVLIANNVAPETIADSIQRETGADRIQMFPVDYDFDMGDDPRPAIEQGYRDLFYDNEADQQFHDRAFGYR